MPENDSLNTVVPEVLAKTTSPFYRSFKFLSGIGILFFILMSFGIYNMFQKTSTPLKPQAVAEKPIKPLKGLIGTVLAVDGKQSTITVKSKDGWGLNERR